jgi:hypothetical protein
MATKGYTLNEMMNFGFYTWTEIARESVSVEGWGCQSYDDCPCCNCDDTVVVKVTYARPRWSKSGKRMVEDTDSFYLCSAHA